jgi:sensory rhodopsin
MFASSFQTSDVTGSALAAATMGSLAAAALMALGLAWVSERWRIPVALAAVALGISALFYMSADELWLAGGKLSAGPRFAAWFAVQPLLVAAAYFFANIAGPVPAGVFWRSTLAAFLMVLCRYLGDAHIFNPVIGVGHGPVIVTLYSIADLVNLIALALIYLAVAGKERY